MSGIVPHLPEAESRKEYEITKEEMYALGLRYLNHLFVVLGFQSPSKGLAAVAHRSLDYTSNTSFTNERVGLSEYR